MNAVYARAPGADWAGPDAVTDVAGTEPGPGPGLTGDPRLDGLIEQLCAEGCQAVRGYIEVLAGDGRHPALEGLDPPQRRRLWRELAAIMAVYGDSCRL